MGLWPPSLWADGLMADGYMADGLRADGWWYGHVYGLMALWPLVGYGLDAL